MIRRHRARLVGLFVLSDVTAIAVSFLYSYLFRFYAYIIPVDPAKGIPSLRSYMAIFPLFLIVHLLIFYFQGFYKSRLKRTKIDDFFYISLNAVLTIIVVLAVLAYINAYSQGQLFHITLVKISRVFLIVYFVGMIFTISILRNQIYYFMKRRYARGLNLQNVLIVGAGDMGKTVAQKLSQYKDLGFVVRGFLDNEKGPGDVIEVDGGVKVLGAIEDLGRSIEEHNIHEVYVALDLKNYSKILETFQIVNKYPVNVRLIPDLFQMLTLKANVQDLDGFPVISIDEVPLQGVNKFLKRLADIAVSASLLVLLSPLIIVTAILVKLTSRGPVFYHQKRMGMDGKHFVIHKFRTMICDAEKATGAVMCKPDDPRITRRLGKFLRKYSIDEIPQLANVLGGKMSLVGPRPERPEFVKEFREKIPKYMLRHKVKSGITGWAQVHGLRQDTSIAKRVEYDFYYIQNWSFSLDLKILWRTFRKGFIDRNLE
ncbi:MAG: undecaprenyl-phosphate glucose phosphotransferase [Candidatus Aminicenantales bacterium]